MKADKALHIDTPLIEHRSNAPWIGSAATYIKLECLQPTGSFKIRGVGLMCQRAAASGARRFVSSSGGNAGLAVCFAGAALGIPVSVIVPSTTAEETQIRLAQAGAEVIVAGNVWDDADVAARKLSHEAGASYIPPFDDPCLWEGHSTIVDEIQRLGVRPDAIVVSVGGGGLMCGVLEGLRRHAWTNVEVIAVETIGADSFHASVAARRLVRLPRITSLAKSLGAAQVASAAIEWTKHHNIRSVVVSDKAAVDACFRFANSYRILVEPACGAALSLLYGCGLQLDTFKSVVVIACGGVGVSIPQLLKWRADLGE